MNAMADRERNKITNMKTGETYIGRLAITGNRPTPPAIARHERAGLSTHRNPTDAQGIRKIQNPNPWRVREG